MRGLGDLGNVSQLMLRLRLEALERREAERAREESVEGGALASRGGLLARAEERLRHGANLTRPEAAAVLGVSTRKLQRMEKAKGGILKRCPNLGMVVRYAARDVLRLASASGGKEA